LEIRKVDQSYWGYFKEHYYLDLPFPPAAEYFIGSVNGELVSHLAVCPFFQASAYRATRLVVMPEWQGAGVGTKFLELICEFHKNGGGRLGRRLPTFFHTSHPQLISYLKRNKKWVLKSQNLYGAKPTPKKKKREKNKLPVGRAAGNYGGHFRAVQGFKYIGGK
jgi:GNAT superfamily N-acetyltransferase